MNTTSPLAKLRKRVLIKRYFHSYKITKIGKAVISVKSVID